jgi:hypothetical protein
MIILCRPITTITKAFLQELCTSHHGDFNMVACNFFLSPLIEKDFFFLNGKKCRYLAIVAHPPFGSNGASAGLSLWSFIFWRRYISVTYQPQHTSRTLLHIVTFYIETLTMLYRNTCQERPSEEGAPVWEEQWGHQQRTILTRSSRYLALSARLSEESAPVWRGQFCSIIKKQPTHNNTTTTKSNSKLIGCRLSTVHQRRSRIKFLVYRVKRTLINYAVTAGPQRSYWERRNWQSAVTKAGEGLKGKLSRAQPQNRNRVSTEICQGWNTRSRWTFLLYCVQRTICGHSWTTKLKVAMG